MYRIYVSFNASFGAQDDIAAKILDALQCRLGTKTLPGPTTDNPKAYEYFLRGRGYAIAGGDRDIAITLNMFQKAVDIDPTFVRAWISLAEQCMFNANFFSKDEQWRRLADKAAAKPKSTRRRRSGGKKSTDEAAGAIEADYCNRSARLGRPWVLPVGE